MEDNNIGSRICGDIELYFKLVTSFYKALMKQNMGIVLVMQYRNFLLLFNNGRDATLRPLE